MVAKDQLVVNAYKAPTMNLENVVDNYTPAIVPQVNDQNISNLFVEGEDFLSGSANLPDIWIATPLTA